MDLSGLAPNLFLFYIVCMSAWMWNVLPNDLIETIEKSRTWHHMVAFAALLFTCNIFVDESQGFDKVILSSIALYFLFILSSKMHLEATIVLIVLLGISYFFYLWSKRIHSIPTHKMTQEEIDEMKKKKYILGRINRLSLVLAVIVVFIANVAYFIEQYKAHRWEDKSFLDFLKKYLFRGSSKVYGLPASALRKLSSMDIKTIENANKLSELEAMTPEVSNTT